MTLVFHLLLQQFYLLNLMNNFNYRRKILISDETVCLNQNVYREILLVLKYDFNFLSLAASIQFIKSKLSNNLNKWNQNC